MYTILPRTANVLAGQATARHVKRCLLKQCRVLSNIALSNINAPLNPNTNNLTKTHLVTHEQFRTAVSSFLNKRTATELWASVSSVSAAGRKRGRGKIKGKKITRDLNKGQILGIGKANIQWPGLSAPIIRGREIVQRQQLPKDEKYQEKLIKMRERVFKLRKQKVSPIDRGWTGGHPEGRKIGPPDPVGDNTFEGFDTVILRQKSIANMTSHFGRFRTVNTLCCTGNGDGLIGFATATSPVYLPALRKAKNRAAQRLLYIPRYENRTVVHDFYSRFYNTRVYVWKQSEGYGLKCHRAIKSVCEMAGIKDLYAKIEGSTHTFTVVRAFVLGLLRQKSFEEISNETNLHIVEMNKDRDFFPQVVSSPNECIDQLEETPNFQLYLFDNKVFHHRSRPKEPFAKLPWWHFRQRRVENIRSHYDANIKLRADHDNELKSFLTEKFPECRPFLPPWTRSLKNADKAKNMSKESSRNIRN